MSQSNFENVISLEALNNVLRQRGLVVVLFVSPECVECGGDISRFRALSRNHANVKFRVVDISVVKNAGARYGIRSGGRSVVIVFKAREPNRLAGTSEREIADAIRRLSRAEYHGKPAQHGRPVHHGRPAKHKGPGAHGKHGGH